MGGETPLFGLVGGSRSGCLQLREIIETYDGKNAVLRSKKRPNLWLVGRFFNGLGADHFRHKRKKESVRCNLPGRAGAEAGVQKLCFRHNILQIIEKNKLFVVQ
jgi:hypothetical protein